MREATEQQFLQQRPCYFDLFVPEKEGKKPLLIGMHGYGGKKESMMRLLRRINEKEFILASLQGPHQHIVYPSTLSKPLEYGFGWLTNFKSEESIDFHHQAVLTVINQLAQDHQADVEQVFLLGFSQAVALNFRFAFTYPDHIKGCIGICGGIPGDWEQNSKFRQGEVEVLYIAGEKDKFYAPERIKKNAHALETRAKKVDLHFFDIGHEVPQETYSLTNQWLLEQTK